MSLEEIEDIEEVDSDEFLIIEKKYL